MDNVFDKMYYENGNLIAGLDEAGVSDIAGPLVAACVVLPKIDIDKDDLSIFNVDDSKKFQEKTRIQLAETVWQTALGIGIGEVAPSEIDYLGRHESIRLAMYRALTACRSVSSGKSVVPDYLMIDKFENIKLPVNIRQNIIPQGDMKSLCIASASIVAKVYRDTIMNKLHEKYPMYGWDSNKGYPCENHFKGLDSYGVQVGIHRIKRWPFKMYREMPEEVDKWSERRKKWRKITATNLQKELGGSLWVKQPSRKEGRSYSKSPSKKPLQASRTLSHETTKIGTD